MNFKFREPDGLGSASSKTKKQIHELFAAGEPHPKMVPRKREIGMLGSELPDVTTCHARDFGNLAGAVENHLAGGSFQIQPLQAALELSHGYETWFDLAGQDVLHGGQDTMIRAIGETQ